MAHSTMGIFLMYKASTNAESYTKLCDITSTPDLEQTPEALDATTLSDFMHKYVQGLKDPGGSLEFGAWFTAADMTTVNAIANTEVDLAIWYGGTVASGATTVTPSGSILKAAFTGYVNYAPAGAEVDAVIPANVTVTPTSAMAYTIGTD